MNPAEVRRLLEKEKLEKDVLNRITWDVRLDGENFSVKYVDRRGKKLVEAQYKSIKVDGDFFHHKDSLIPMHRIREILYKGIKVWSKRRTD